VLGLGARAHQEGGRLLPLPADHITSGRDASAAVLAVQQVRLGYRLERTDGQSVGVLDLRRPQTAAGHDSVLRRLAAWLLPSLRDQASLRAKMTAPGTSLSGPITSSASMVNLASRSKPATVLGRRW
jgi:hypothetical protein